LADLRATVIIDYQNVYDTGTGVFGSSLIPGTGFVHPLRYADELIRIRNQSQPMATLSKVLVYRGLPHSAHEPRKNAWNKAQKPLLDAKGTRIVIWPPREKGIDVHCALALIRESLNPEVDLVILCTQDTDLVPALDEACRMGAAKVETASWYDRRQNRRNFPIHPTNSSTVWNTELGYANFFASLDPKVYRSR
jgi:hypothetical protein